jgi:uncharacterized MAPEG superfamily protein
MTSSFVSSLLDINLKILLCAVALGLFQLLLSVSFNVAGRGIRYGAGARDMPPKPLGKWASRTERAYKNFLETFPFFAAAVLVEHALNTTAHASPLGAQVYIWARTLYVPAYLCGIPFLRTSLWTASIVGIVIILAADWRMA